MKLVLFLTAACLLGAGTLRGQSPDEVIFAEKMRLPAGHTLAETVVTLAQSFEGTPYVPHTLETSADERLTVNLRAFDCATFVETVLALEETKNSQQFDFQTFKTKLQALRYRNGQVAGYGSRLHYFSDWLAQNCAAGRLTDLTAQLGGIPWPKAVDFMTTHRNLYASLNNKLTFNQLKESEREINRHLHFFIPKKNAAALEGQLQNGDVVAFTSLKPGLDVAHEGFVVKKNGRAFLLHASSEAGRVLLAAEPLDDYLTRISNLTGVLVARPAP